MTDRTSIFAAVRDMLGRGFTTDEVRKLDAALDAVGLPRVHEEKPEADPFDAALSVILHHEGGFVNHPKDPGGMTNLGVTKKVWEEWTERKVGESEMRALTPAKVAPLYRRNYWEAVKCDDLPPALALCVFDFAVNAGPGRAARYLQQLVGVAQDGKIGPATLAAVKVYVAKHGAAKAVTAYQEARRVYYRSLSTFNTFGKGWLRRVAEVEKVALAMAGGGTGNGPPLP